MESVRHDGNFTHANLTNMADDAIKAAADVFI